MLRCSETDESRRLASPPLASLRVRILRFCAIALARVIDGAAWVGSRLPSGLAHGLAAAGGNIQWALRPKRRRDLAANLCHAVGARPDDPLVKRTVRRVMINESHAAADLLWAIGRPRDFLDTVVYENWHYVDDTVSEGRGLILAGTHLGGWEVATAIPGEKVPVPTNVIVADNWIAWAIEHVRSGVGLRVMYRQAAALRSVRRLQDGEAVLLLGDNSEFAGHTHRVRFLDSEMQMAAGVAALARLAGSPIISFTVLPLGPRRWKATMDPPIEPPPPRAGRDGEQVVLQQLADRWSEAIRANPEHWSMAAPLDWIDASAGTEPRSERPE
ncbi:MAG: lysophospholipid acyltransferase family protein [Acidimicrobiaceae bacterium]|nr:lysophospholipid acyltransferase family protein [Acidimicrobiaceae bacterium]